MESKDIQAKLDKLDEQLGQLTNKQAEELTNVGKLHEETKKEVDTLIAKATELTEKQEKQFNSLKEQYNELDLKLQKTQTSTYKGKGFAYEISKTLKENEEKLKAFRKDPKTITLNLKGTGRDMVLKADMTGAADYTGDVVEPDFDNQIYRDPVQNTLRIRSLLSAASTQSNSFRFIQRSGYSDATARVAEGAAIPQSDFDLTRVTRTIEKIGARMDFTIEMLEDTEMLRSFIVAELVDNAIVKEDQQLLYGTGTNQLYGISAEATAYVDDGLAQAQVQEIDVLINAASYLESNDKYMAAAMLVAPKEYYKMHRLKDSGTYAKGDYLNNSLVYDGGQLRLIGIPLFKSTAVTAGDFFVGDFRRYGKIVDRAGMQVQFSFENDTNFEEDQVTAKVTYRLALAATNPKAVIYGDFASALAQGSA